MLPDDGPWDDPPAPPSSWATQDVMAAFYDDSPLECPSLAVRSDDSEDAPRALFYPGRSHTVFGSSGSGKSWLALVTVVEQANRGNRVMFLDFESDLRTVIGRCKRLGLREECAPNIEYAAPTVRPAEPPPPHETPAGYVPSSDALAWRELETTPRALIVIDGVTSALGIWGAKSNDADTVSEFMRTFPNRLAASSGAAVVMIDHITKEEGKGRKAYPGGSMQKLALVTGAAYLAERDPVAPFAPGGVGRMHLFATKDRIGQVAAFWEPPMSGDDPSVHPVATLVLDSRGDAIRPSLVPCELEMEAPSYEDPRDDVEDPLCAVWDHAKKWVTREALIASACLSDRQGHWIDEAVIRGVLTMTVFDNNPGHVTKYKRGSAQPLPGT